jgi:hypothetical protein
MHREAKGHSVRLLRPEQGIPDHLLMGPKDLAVPNRGGGVEVVLVTAARASKNWPKIFEISQLIPSPFDGGGGAGLPVGRGGGGRNRDHLVPPPLCPLPRWGGEFL